jgi:hypothetical protein
MTGRSPGAAALGFQGAGRSLHKRRCRSGLSWLENGCAVLPAPDREWLNSASVCQAPGKLGAADRTGHTVRLGRSTDLPPRGVQADDGAHLDVER